MKKLLFLFCLSFAVVATHAQQNITVHFLYGSVPAKGQLKTEKKVFGGKKGGHVTIEAGDSIFGFQPKGTCHMIGMKKNANGYFKAEQKTYWTKDTVSKKYTSVVIPVTAEQYAHVKNTFDQYLQKSPYDYAFLGMRCAAASYDVLEDIGVVKKRSRVGKWLSFFYPQLLRRKMIKLAEKNEYALVKHEGRKTRNWEME
ncbi:MAG: hypothetical protein JWQ27_2437 [Ferruginibacter sp.]|nr:hypothetical protein [Ferruginibacter sp.]